MNPKTAIHSSEVRDYVLALAGCCPVDQCNSPDCPLYQVRQLKLSDRVHWLQALDDDDLHYLAAYHHVCLTAKIRSLPKLPSNDLA